MQYREFLSMGPGYDEWEGGAEDFLGLSTINMKSMPRTLIM